jgi:hypothetical protein
MRLLVDMNLTPRWVEFLASAEYEAVHWSSVGPVQPRMPYMQDPDLQEIDSYCASAFGSVGVSASTAGAAPR